MNPLTIPARWLLGAAERGATRAAQLTEQLRAPLASDTSPAADGRRDDRIAGRRDDLVAVASDAANRVLRVARDVRVEGHAVGDAAA
ncbi:MAG: hypothetical protein AAF772_15110, partial [Acidobacteriota bacterium]